jgi:glycine/D-amino acid oxidase-like deaminating enzyme
MEPNLSPDVRGGVLFSSQGFVGATDMIRALVAGARKHGARLVQQGRVLRITRRAGETQVVTERGAIVADIVVVAAGSWSGQVAVEGAEPAPVTPVRGQLLHLAWTSDSPSRVLWGERCYAIPWPDGTVLVGATVEQAGFDESATVDGVRGLLDAAAELLPAARAARFVSVRVGLRPATPDHLPIIGRSAAMPSVFYATGHYRNGVLLAPLTARLVADAILDDHDDPALALTAPARFGAL